jgi:transposase InsO family protein
MLCLMSRKGDRWGNAPTESFFGSFRTELLVDEPFETRPAGRTALFGFIEGFYNRARLHSAIDGKAATRTQPLAAAA